MRSRRPSRLLVAAALALLVSPGAGLALTAESWEETVQGKTVFLKFFAPWCSHCKKLAPTWHRVAEELSNYSSFVMATVDCTSHKELCEKHGVKGYPTLKYGDPEDLVKYKGGRTYEAISKKALTLATAECSLDFPNLCDIQRQGQIEFLRTLAAEELDARIWEGERDSAQARKSYEEHARELRGMLEDLERNERARLESLEKGDLGLMKEVLRRRKNPDWDKEEPEVREFSSRAGWLLWTLRQGIVEVAGELRALAAGNTRLFAALALASGSLGLLLGIFAARCCCGGRHPASQPARLPPSKKRE